MGADEQSDYGPTWYSGVTPLPPPRTPLNYDLDVDVCVIGGGLSGVTAARAGAGRGWGGGGVGARPACWEAAGPTHGVGVAGPLGRDEKKPWRVRPSPRPG